MNKGVHPPQCTNTFFPLSHSHPPSFLPRVFFLFVLNIHLLAGLWWCQLASQSFSFHTGDTRPQHVQRFQTHLKSVHKRRKRKKNITSTLHSPQTVARSPLYIQHTAQTPWLHLQSCFQDEPWRSAAPPHRRSA